MPCLSTHSGNARTCALKTSCSSASSTAAILPPSLRQTEAEEPKLALEGITTLPGREGRHKEENSASSFPRRNSSNLAVFQSTRSPLIFSSLKWIP